MRARTRSSPLSWASFERSAAPLFAAALLETFGVPSRQLVAAQQLVSDRTVVKIVTAVMVVTAVFRRSSGTPRRVLSVK